MISLSEQKEKAGYVGEVSHLCALSMCGKEQLNKRTNIHTVFWVSEYCLLVERIKNIPEDKLVLLI